MMIPILKRVSSIHHQSLFVWTHGCGHVCAQEMNKYHFLDKDLQYNFYLNILRKRKRFSPWIRKDKVSDLDYVKRYYGYSNEKHHKS